MSQTELNFDSQEQSQDSTGSCVYQHTVAEAIRALDQRCDGAKSKDEMGFNAVHTHFGKYIAQLPESEWGELAVWVAYQDVLPVYKDQLLNYGIDYGLIKPPPCPEEYQQGATIALVNGQLKEKIRVREALEAGNKGAIRLIEWDAEVEKFRIYFPKRPRNKEDNAILDDVRLIPGRWFEFHGEFKHWTAPRSSKEYVMELGERFGFIITDEARNVQVIDVDDLASVESFSVFSVEEVEPEPYLLVFEDDLVKIQTPYDRELIDAVKEVPGRRYIDESKEGGPRYWQVSQKRLESLAGLFDVVNGDERFPADHIAQLKALLDARQVIEQETTTLSCALDTSIPDWMEEKFATLGGTLRPFQKVAIKFADQFKKVLLSEDMGVGKTIEALGLLHLIDAFPALVVVPATLKLNWCKEALTWLPDRSVGVNFKQKKPIAIRLPSGKTAYVPPGYFSGSKGLVDIYVTNYEALRKEETVDALKQIGFKAVIYDESHRLKNRKAQQTQGCKAVSKGIDHVLLLSGTPIENRPIELVTQLEVLGRLQELGGFWYYVKHYCAAEEVETGIGRYHWDMSGSSNMIELHDNLRSKGIMIRRTKEQVLTDLPEMQRTTIPFQITNRKEYERAQNQFLAWLYDQYKERAGFQVQKAKMSAEEQVVFSPYLAEWQRAFRAEHLVRIERLKQLAVEGKFKALLDWIESFLDTGESLVVFGIHTDFLQRISQHFDNAPMIIGDTPLIQRQENVDRFQNFEDKLIVCNLKAAGEGITLTAASNVATFELAWNPARHDQGEARCHRLGAVNAVNCWYLVAQDTIEEELATLIENKRKVMNAVLDGKAEIPKEGLIGDVTKILMQWKKNAQKVSEELVDQMQDVLFDWE